jgi:hypothetical protein
VQHLHAAEGDLQPGDAQQAHGASVPR